MTSSRFTAHICEGGTSATEERANKPCFLVGTIHGTWPGTPLSIHDHHQPPSLVPEWAAAVAAGREYAVAS
jgi:hypothetical protein